MIATARRSLSNRWMLCAALLVSVLGGCANVDEPAAAREANDLTEIFDGLDLEENLLEKSGAISGLPSTFNRQAVMEDSFFLAPNAVDAAAVQAFFERGPYNGGRSFLADLRVGGRSAAQALVDAARAEGLNPVLLVSRMQVEKGLVSLARNPGGNRVDYAFGCGCPDNRSCNSAYRGLDKQLACAARTLRRGYDDSVAGSGVFVRGRAKRTLDPISITPANHATASLYTYTPWVQQGRGGNWLVWNVTLRHARHFASQGTLNAGGGGNVSTPPGGGGAPAVVQSWIGDRCTADAECNFGDRQGLCASGRCALSCEGLCPDRAGSAPTFCVDAVLFGIASGGLCASQADSRNGNCSDNDLNRMDVPRFVGNSTASARRASVCVPALADNGSGPGGSEDPGAWEDPTPDPVPEPEPEPEPDDAPCNAGSAWCEGDVRVECVASRPVRFDCGLAEATCSAGRCQGPVQPEPETEPEQSAEGCGQLDSYGSCRGDVAARCVNGSVVSEDCSRYGQACDFAPSGAACAPVEGPVGYSANRCAGLGFEGTCEGQFAVWCDGDALFAVHCAWTGSSCGWGDDGSGYWCR